MAIPSKQIGWSEKANLLWNIAKQFEKLTQVASNIQIAPVVSTTTTTTTIPSTTTTTTTGAPEYYYSSRNCADTYSATLKSNIPYSTGNVVFSTESGECHTIGVLTSGPFYDFLIASQASDCTSAPCPTTTSTTTVAPGDNFIATENGDLLITESGDNLIVNYPLPTSPIITEAGDFVITENGDFLTTQ